MTDGNVPAGKAAKCVPAGAKHLISNYTGSMAETLKPYEAHVWYAKP